MRVPIAAGNTFFILCEYPFDLDDSSSGLYLMIGDEIFIESYDEKSNTFHVVNLTRDMGHGDYTEVELQRMVGYINFSMEDFSR